MAVTFWTNGAATGEWETAANWHTAAIPISGDIAVFTGERSNDNVTAAANVDGPDSVYVSADYSGTIGQSGSPITFETTAVDTFVYSGTGNCYISSSGVDVTAIVCRTDNRGADALKFNGSTAGVDVIKGRFTLQGSADIASSNLNISSETSRLSDAVCIIEAGATTTSMTCNMAGGQLEAAAAVPTINMDGGIASVTVGNITTANLNSNALLKYETDGGTLTTGTVFSGTIDVAQNGATRTLNQIYLFGLQSFLETRNATAKATLTFNNNTIVYGGTSGQVLQAASDFQVDVR